MKIRSIQMPINVVTEAKSGTGVYKGKYQATWTDIGRGRYSIDYTSESGRQQNIVTSDATKLKITGTNPQRKKIEETTSTPVRGAFGQSNFPDQQQAQQKQTYYTREPGKKLPTPQIASYDIKKEQTFKFGGSGKSSVSSSVSDGTKRDFITEVAVKSLRPGEAILNKYQEITRQSSEATAPPTETRIESRYSPGRYEQQNIKQRQLEDYQYYLGNKKTVTNLQKEEALIKSVGSPVVRGVVGLFGLPITATNVITGQQSVTGMFFDTVESAKTKPFSTVLEFAGASVVPLPKTPGLRITGKLTEKVSRGVQYTKNKIKPNPKLELGIDLGLVIEDAAVRDTTFGIKLPPKKLKSKDIVAQLIDVKSVEKVRKTNEANVLTQLSLDVKGKIKYKAKSTGDYIIKNVEGKTDVEPFKIINDGVETSGASINTFLGTKVGNKKAIGEIFGTVRDTRSVFEGSVTVGKKKRAVVGSAISERYAKRLNKNFEENFLVQAGESFAEGGRASLLGGKERIFTRRLKNVPKTGSGIVLKKRVKKNTSFSGVLVESFGKTLIPDVAKEFKPIDSQILVAKPLQKSSKAVIKYEEKTATFIEPKAGSLGIWTPQQKNQVKYSSKSGIIQQNNRIQSQKVIYNQPSKEKPQKFITTTSFIVSGGGSRIKPKQTPAIIERQGEKKIPKQIQFQFQRPKQEQTIKQIQGLIQKPVTKPGIITPPHFLTIPSKPIRKPKQFHGESFISDIFRQKKSKKKVKAKSVYSPQIYSIITGLVGKRPKVLTGLEIRPIVIGKGRK
jgi:hypothetical protein